LECAVVKEGISRHCANLLPLTTVHDLIIEKARLAIGKTKTIPPFKVDSPVEIRVEYFRNDMVDGIREREGVKKVGPREVAYLGDDIVKAFDRVRGG